MELNFFSSFLLASYQHFPMQFLFDQNNKLTDHFKTAHVQVSKSLTVESSRYV